METVKQIHVGNTIVGGNGSLFVMAGPCVIEDPERTLNIGRKMKEICERLGLPYIFKASFDKANRSSYTSYRGPGLTEGLRILGDIKKELQVPVVSDVHESPPGGSGRRSPGCYPDSGLSLPADGSGRSRGCNG